MLGVGIVASVRAHAHIVMNTFKAIITNSRDFVPYAERRRFTNSRLPVKRVVSCRANAPA
jgi:hypothetical protein